MACFSSGRVFLISLFLSLQLPFALAQHQRLALAPETFTLTGKGKVRIAEAYCLDLHIYASNSFVPYTQVINEGAAAKVRVGRAAPIPLQTAIARGIISIEGSAVAKVEGRTIAWDQAKKLYGDDLRDRMVRGGTGLGLRIRSNVAEPVTILINEPTALGEQEGDLIAKGSPILAPLKQPRVVATPSAAGRAKPQPKNAVKMQDDIWKAQQSDRILAELDYLHEPVNPDKIKEALTKFQADYGLPSGALDGATESELEKQDKKLLDEMSEIGFGPAAPEPGASQMVAASKSIQRFTRYHDMEVTGVYTDAVKAQVAKDKQILEQLKQVAGRPGGPDNLLASAEFPGVVTFFRTQTGITALCKSEDKLDLWSLKGKSVERRVGTGEAVLEEFQDRFVTELGGQVSEDILVLPAGYSSDELIEGLFRMNAEGTAENAGGDKDARRKKVLLAVSPLLQGRATSEFSKTDSWKQSAGNPLQLARKLQADIREKADVFVTNDAVLGFENLKNLPVFSKPQDMVIYVDGKIQDRGVVDTLFGSIDKSKIQVVAADKAKPGQGRVSLMVGENDDNFRELVLKKADEGIFQDGILALAKCGEGGELAFNSEIIHRSKARAVIFYDELINIQAVKDVLYEFTKELRENGIPDGDFKSAWLKSVDRAAEAASGDYKDQILKLQNVHVQVRDVPPILYPSDKSDA